MKPGIKTTEFILSLLAILISAVLGSDLLLEGSLAVKIVTVVGAVLAALGYTASRTLVKRAALSAGGEEPDDS